MKIVRNSHKVIQFKDLRIGDVFITVEDDHVYMRTDEAYEYLDDPDHICNAVSLGDGSLVRIKDYEKVFIPKNVTLTIDE